MITAVTFQKAIEFAAVAHKGQFRKGDGRPYILHPISVMMRIMQAKGDSANLYLLATVAILHDTVEDCGVLIETIAKEFGYHVAALVQELTLDKEQYEILGKKEYLAQEVVKMSSYALAIKLADRLDNVCDMANMGNDFQQRYTEETLYILNNLFEKRRLTDTHLYLFEQISEELDKYTK